MKNHRVVVTEHGGPDVLQLVEEDPPEPGPSEVRIKVLAAGVSAFDLIYRRWAHLPGSPKLPFTLGEDVVGVVDQNGPRATVFEAGQMVAGGTWAFGVGGGYSEFLCLPESELVTVPAGVDPAEAACLVVNYLTAHEHLHHIAGARSGERLLVHGAAGGVGTALLQLGKLAGLEMFGTAARDQHELVSSLGATPIDYQTEDFVARIQALTDDGVDVVIDPVGGAKQLWRSYRTLRQGGRLVWLGSAAVDQQGLRVAPFSMAMALLLRLIPDGKRVPSCPTLDKHAKAHPDWYHTTLTELLDALATNQLEPVIAQRIPLAEAARAHELLERGGHTGKVVLTTDAYDNT
ncbi:MAG: zinc-binding dehydrogenase [Actinomycetia bacterium]|nr:zinc-binding dehydrogenase [Actinomycetes bacterium]